VRGRRESADGESWSWFEREREGRVRTGWIGKREGKETGKDRWEGLKEREGKEEKRWRGGDERDR